MATFFLAALPSVMSSPAPIDTTLPNLVTPKNSLNELSMVEYAGDGTTASSTIILSVSATSVSPSTASSTSISRGEKLHTTYPWSVGLAAFAGVIVTIL
ncbi:hypothetical protein CPB84DRAFT_1841998 [Gymnopilus junonius]|uniref:Uncharacterized protein n=1 Tax=Gymnopilus junonius TaxID=109634 RepID=A0A9P5NX15_GYMJU|nr:hypothetical protein CPB84DRAFT_1841998 [Gymnopilus junonius]